MESVWQRRSPGWLGHCKKAPAVRREHRGVVELRAKEFSSDRATN